MKTKDNALPFRQMLLFLVLAFILSTMFVVVLILGIAKLRMFNFDVTTYSVNLNIPFYPKEQLQKATESLRNQLKISDDSQSASPLRISSSTWTTATSNEGHAVTPHTTLSGDTNDSGQLGSWGTTVSAKVVLTSMRPPPAPARTGSNSGGTHRGVTFINNRIASPTLPQIAPAESSRKSQGAVTDILESSASLHSRVEQNSSGW